MAYIDMPHVNKGTLEPSVVKRIKGPESRMLCTSDKILLGG